MSDTPRAAAGGGGQYVRRPGRPRGVGGPVGSRRPTTSTSSDEMLAATGVRWDPEMVALDRIGRSTVTRARQRFEASLPDLVWNAAALEGNTFTLPEVRTLLDGVTVGGRPIEDERQVLALVGGYSQLDELVGEGRFLLDKEVSDDLHGRVAVHEAIESGAFRGEGSVGGGGTVQLASGGFVTGVPQDELPARFSNSVEYLASLEDPRERALAYFASATRAQYYCDGNKRTARLMMTGLLMSEAYDAVSIPFARAFEFNQALDTLFADDDATPIMAFIADCAVR